MRVALIEPLGQSGPLDIAYSLGTALRDRGLDATLVTTRCHQPPTDARDGLPLVALLGGMERGRHRLWRALDYAESLLPLWRFLRRGRFDLLHFQDTLLPHLDAPFLAALRKSGSRLVFTVQDPDQEAINSSPPRPGPDGPPSGGGPNGRLSLRRLALRRIYATADHLVTLSECGRRDLVNRFGVPDGKVTTTPHGNYLCYLRGGCPRATEARTQLGIPRDRSVVLFFGAIKPTKGLDHLLRAFGRVRRVCPQSLLLVAGEPRRGVNARRFRDLARREGIWDATIFHFGYVPAERLPFYFAAADVVALPYTNVYQSGVAQVAYGFRRPVVASRVGGLAEVVEDGRTGLLVPPADEEALAEALVKLLFDAEARRRMGAQGRRLAEEKYSWEAIAGKTAAVYESVLEGTVTIERGGK